MCLKQYVPTETLSLKRAPRENIQQKPVHLKQYRFLSTEPFTGRSLQVQERCLWNIFPCEMQLREVTQWLGLADGLGILIVLAWGILFQNCHIPRMVRKNDDAHLTPPDFAVDITVLPYKLTDGHEAYEEKLKQHFLSILRSLGIEDSSAIAEVCLVRNYDGAISTFLQKGNLILSQHGDIIRMKDGT